MMKKLYLLKFTSASKSRRVSIQLIFNVFIFFSLSFINSQTSANTCDLAENSIPIDNSDIFYVGTINGIQSPQPNCIENYEIYDSAEWFRYTPYSNSVVTISSDLPQNNNQDTRLSVYKGNCQNLVCVTGNDDSNGQLTSTVTFVANANETYFIVWDSRHAFGGFDFSLSESETLNISDSEFENSLIVQGIDSDQIINNSVLLSDILFLSELDISNSNISDLSSIFAFQSLISLNISNNQLTSFNIEELASLEILNCSQNNLTSLNLSKNNNLKYLDSSVNLLESINLNNNHQLETLNLANNNLESLSILNQQQLDFLDCTNNLLTELNVSSNPLLSQLYFGYNQLTEVNLENNQNLVGLIAENNQINFLDLSFNSNLSNVIVNNNSLYVLNLKNGNPYQIIDFDATNNPNLYCIEVDDPDYSNLSWQNIDNYSEFTDSCNNLTFNVPDQFFEETLVNNNIDTDGLINGVVKTQDVINLTNLNLNDWFTSPLGSIESLEGIENFKSLITLNLSTFYNLQTLNLNSNPDLEFITLFESNSLTNLEITGNSKLKSLTINGSGGSQLNNLDLTSNYLLEELTLTNSVLNDLNLQNQVNLKNLNLSGSTALISQIDFTNNHNLESIILDHSSIQILDLSNKPSLVNIEFALSAIETLIIDNSTNINRIIAPYNSLNALDISSCINFNELNVWNGENLNCINVNQAQLDNQSISWNIPYWTQLSTNCLGGPIVTISDPLFEQALIDLGYDHDNLINGQVTEIDIKTRRTLNINDYGISDLTGIEHFLGLEELYANNNNIHYLDLSNNSNLEWYWLNNNNLIELNVQNGNNDAIAVNSNNFQVFGNSNLTCIEVDDVEFSETYWRVGYPFNNVPDYITFSLNCHYDEIYIPDNNFEQALINQDYDQPPLDNYILKSVAEEISELNLSNLDISDLSGINGFTNLEYLDVSSNQVSSLNIDGLVNLNYLDCSGNSINSIALQNNVLLSELNCSNNQIELLDISLNEQLTILTANYNQISEFISESNSNPSELDLSNNQLISLELSNLTNLTKLFINSNELQSLNLRNNNNVLLTNNNINLMSNSSLECVDVDDEIWSTQTWFNIDPQTNFSNDCSQYYTMIPDNNFETLLVNNNIDTDGVVNGKVKTSDIIGIQTLYLGYSNIFNLEGIQSFTNLEYLDVSGNNLTSLDVSENTLLEVIDCSNNNLESIILGSNISLSFLDCNSNNLNELDVSENYGLTTLFCMNNQISTLDISNNESLFDLYCQFNNMETIIFNEFILPLFIDCSFNNLTSLQFASGTNQTRTSQINYYIEYLDCSYNEIQNLDLSQVFFGALNCKNNNLNTLNIKNGFNTDIYNFNSKNNPNLYCIEVDDPTYSELNWTDSIDQQQSFSLSCLLSNSNEINKIIFKIYPNPTKEILNIPYLFDSNIQIYDLNGRLILNLEEFNGNKIDVSDIEESIYVLKIKTEDKIFNTNFIKN